MSKQYGNATAQEWVDRLPKKIEEPGNSWPSSAVVVLMKALLEMATVLVELEEVCKNVDPTAFPKDRQEDS